MSMSLLIVMLPLMIGFALVLLGGLMWAVRHGQFEDMEGEKHRIFFDEPGYGEQATRPLPR
jgi:cbb3-type cytochrome oxidase maturation protein